MKKIGWGIIGCGQVTELKSGPAFRKVEGSELVAVMRRQANLARDYAVRHGIKRWYDDASALIHDNEIDAVYVATPPDSHAKYAIQTMRAGKPVYVEKPMARTYAECEEMIRVSEETKQLLFVAYYRRTLTGFLKVKEWLEQNEIGDVTSVEIKLYKAFAERDANPATQTWHIKPEIAGAGHFYDLASHQFDLLDFLLGEIVDVEGQASNQAGLYKAEDTVEAKYMFRSGLKGTGSWCFVADKAQEVDSIKIKGSQGEIIFSCFDKKPFVLISRGKTTTFEAQNHENISFNLVKQVNECLQGKNNCVSNMYSAARTNWLLEEIVKKYYSSK